MLHVSKFTLLALQDARLGIMVWSYFSLLCASCSYLHVSSLGFIGCSRRVLDMCMDQELQSFDENGSGSTSGVDDCYVCRED